jgi:glycosyltransferase involved in cell wall biosynthesis
VARVAVLAEGYLPGFKSGGPIVSVSRIIESDADQDFRVITRNHDEGETEPYVGFRARAWQTVGRAQVAYLRPGVKDLGWIVSQLRADKPDVYYLNSLHSPWFTLLPLLAIKFHVLPRTQVLLAPRGETSMGALGLKSKKKALGRPLIKWLIGRSITWHFSSELEANEVINWWGVNLPTGHRTVVQMDPAIAPRTTASAGPPPGSPVITFASRIDPMKGLDDAIRIVATLHVPVEFRVYGVVSDEDYWEACRQLADRELGAGTMRYMGPYEPRASQDLFAAGSLFLFPTHGENFGHVVSEALSVGCPVVVTANTPWTEVVEAGGGHVMRDQQATLRYLDAILESGGAESVRNRESVRLAYESWYLTTACASSIFAVGE